MSQTTLQSEPLPIDPPQISRGLGSQVRLYLEMVRFSHTIFAMPFAILAGLWCVALGFSEQSWNSPAISPLRWLATILCMVTARNFAMTVNRLADRQHDASNPRTAARHLPAGLISVRAAIGFCVANAVGFVLSCILFMPNWLPLVLAGPLLLFLGGYSYAKRLTAGVHFYLGLSLMLAPICVWLALRGEVLQVSWLDGLPAILIGAVVLLWVSGFDLIYACQDFVFDRAAGLYSMPARIGVKASLRLAAVLHTLLFIPAILLLLLCPQLNLGWIYGLGLATIVALLVYEHWLVRPDDLSRVNAAFFQANAVIGLIFLISGGLDAWI